MRLRTRPPLLTYLLTPSGRFLGSTVAGEGELAGADARLWGLCLGVPSLPPHFPPPLPPGEASIPWGVPICLFVLVTNP